MNNPRYFPLLSKSSLNLRSALVSWFGNTNAFGDIVIVVVVVVVTILSKKEEDEERKNTPSTCFNIISDVGVMHALGIVYYYHDFNFVFAHFEPSIPQNEDRTNTIIKTSANRYRRFMLTFLLNNHRKTVGTRNMKPFPFKHGTTIVFIPRCCLFLDIIVAPLSTSILVKGLFESSISFALFTRSRIFVWYCFCLLVLAFCLVMRRLQEKRNVNEE